MTIAVGRNSNKRLGVKGSGHGEKSGEDALNSCMGDKGMQAVKRRGGECSEMQMNAVTPSEQSGFGALSTGKLLVEQSNVVKNNWVICNQMRGGNAHR
uniref:Uncharacterized protein n=1 Tax=Physcomitrium patens TaxID=3218 RepID=A0A2K1IFU3_PHYPA|nr:hypothetical protein PHYPA_028738 [Physcomitrium patens]